MITAKGIAYVIIGIGCVFSLITAIVPHAPGAFRVAYGLFFLGLLPYFVYLCLTEMLHDTALVIPGAFICGVDVCVKVFAYLSYGSLADNNVLVYLPLVLTLLILPLGVALGKQMTKQSSVESGADDNKQD